MTVVHVFLSVVTRDSSDYEPTGTIYNDNDVVRNIKAGNYIYAASLRSDIADGVLEDIYRRTQNHERNWNPTAPKRSTMVGDVFVIGEEFHVVASCGFTKIETGRLTLADIAAVLPSAA